MEYGSAGCVDEHVLFKERQYLHFRHAFLLDQ